MEDGGQNLGGEFMGGGSSTWLILDQIMPRAGEFDK